MPEKIVRIKLTFMERELKKLRPILNKEFPSKFLATQIKMCFMWAMEKKREKKRILIQQNFIKGDKVV